MPPPGNPAPHLSSAPYDYNPFAIEDIVFRAEEIARTRISPEDAINAWDFYIPFADVSAADYIEGDTLRSEMRRALGVDDFWGRYKHTGFRVLKPRTDTETGVAVADFSREQMLAGTAEDIGQRIALGLQYLQIGQGAKGLDALKLTGRQLRPEWYAAAGRQVANRLSGAGRHMVFDIETAGLNRDAGIWQISAQLMEGEREVRSLNIFFDLPAQDAASWGGMSFDEFYRRLRAGDVGAIGELIPRTEFARGITPFLEMAREADYLVGHNTFFDVEHIEYGLRNTNAYKNIESFRALADEFSAKVRSDRFIDTRLIAQAVLPDINVSKHLQDLGEITRFSMENLLLESTLLHDIEAKISRVQNYSDAFTTQENIQKYGTRARAAVYGRLEAGLHFGDIDTWFENHLFGLSRDYLQGNRNILRSETVTDQRIQKAVRAGAAMTPTTIISREMTERVAAGMAPEEAARVRGMAGLTILEYGAKAARAVAAAAGRVPRMRFGDRTLYEAGLFSRWMDPFITAEGLPQRALRFGQGYEAVQERAVRMGLPFADVLSPLERVLTSMLGRTPMAGAGAGPFNRARELAGDIIGTGVWRAATEANAWSRGNVALPRNLIQEAQRRGVLSNTKFAEAFADNVEGVQLARLDPFTTLSGKREIALVAHIFSNQEEVKGFSDWLATGEAQAVHSIEPKLLKDIQSNLLAHGRELGVQIGTLGGLEGGQDVGRLHSALEHWGLNLKSSNMSIWTAVMAGPTDDTITSGALMLGENVKRSRGVPIDPNLIMPHLEAQQRLDRYARERIPMSTRLQWGLRTSRGSEDANIRKTFDMLDRFLGGPGITNTPTASDATKRIWGMPRGRAMGVATLAAGLGYYAYKKLRGQEPYNDTMQQMPLEGPEFYAQYGRRMGEPSYDPLATAGTVQALDASKTRHHQMGSQKYDHLFFGG